MKKSLLMMASAAFATVTFAQRSALADMPVIDAAAASCVEECAAQQEVSFMNFGASAAKKVSTKAAVKAWYNRPAGAFYLTCYTTEGKAGYSTFYAPYLMVHPYEYYEFTSASTDAVSQTWKVWYQDGMQPASLEVDDSGFICDWGLELDTVPRLTAKGADGAESVYQIGGFNGTTAYLGNISSYPGYPGMLYSSSTVVRHAWASPKFFAARSNRDGSLKAGAYYATVKDADNNSLGNLMGRNKAGIDAMAIAVEKPTHAYAVNAVGVRFQSLQMASSSAEATLVANIYKVASIPSYTDGYVTITPGEKIATSKVTLSEASILETPEFSKSSSTGKYSGIMYFPLEETLNVDDAIMVEITGYNVDAITDFTSLYSSDYFEEGYGEIGYIKQDGKYISMRGSYVNGERSTAPAILLEVENPFLTWNYENETGEGSFADQGETKTIDMFTYHPASDMKITIDENGRTPDWLTAKASDDMSSGEFGYLTYLNVRADELPAGTDYREATVTISYPGAELVYTAKQGKEPTGINDVKAADAQKAQKVVENGQIYILIGDKKYNVMGAEVK